MHAWALEKLQAGVLFTTIKVDEWRRTSRLVDLCCLVEGTRCGCWDARATPPDRAWIKCSCCTFNEDKPFSRGTVVGKTGKTSVLTWFFGVEHGVGSSLAHKLQTPSEEIAFTAQPKIKSQSQILSYSQSMFCLPHQPKISNFFDLCLHCTGCPYSMVWRACDVLGYCLLA